MRPEQEKALHENMKAGQMAAQGGVLGIPGDCENLAQTQTVDPRRELLYRIDRRVDELLGQVTALRDARRIVEYAGYDALEILRKLEIGGIR